MKPGAIFVNTSLKVILFKNKKGKIWNDEITLHKTQANPRSYDLYDFDKISHDAENTTARHMKATPLIEHPAW